MTWKDAAEYLRGLIILIIGMILQAGLMIWRGGRVVGSKEEQFKVFGEELRSIKDELWETREERAKITSDMRAIRQALYDNGIKISNGGH